MSATAAFLIASLATVACFVALALSVRSAREWRSRTRSISRPLHELRGAINALHLGLVVVERACTGTDAAQRVSALHAQIDRATTALSDIDRRRTGVRDAAPQDLHQPLDLEALVCSRVRSWQQIACGYRTRVRLEWRAGPARAFGDAGQLASALDNLIANALEHGGGRVLVEGERSANTLRVMVSDGGHEAPDLSTVGEADWRSARGHGLAIARDAVEAHGGRLVTRARLTGTAIAIELPLQATAAPEHRQSPDAPAPPIRRRVPSAA
jgi:signal transduction histidine kinase